MAAMREIRAHIKNVKSTQKITKAMKMVSVSKLRRVQSAMEAMRPFTRKSGEILAVLSGGDEIHSNVLIQPRSEVKKVCYVLFVSNRGLCGAYNSNLLRYMADLAASAQRTYSVVVCGRWGKDVIRKAGLPVERVFDDIGDTPSAEQGIRLAEYLKRMYLNGEADEVVLVYQKFVNALSQTPCKAQLLPEKPEEAEEKTTDKAYLFEPDRPTILENVLHLHINSTVYSALLEARAGEHASRMRAMTAASDNTQELIAELRLKLNRARQAAITTEIAEIAGGASALKHKK